LRASAGSTLSDALVLGASDYRDADRIVTLFTERLGKVSALARAARASRRRFGGVLEPYAVIRVSLAPSRGELYTLERAELVRAFVAILGDLDRMDAAGAALSLCRTAQEVRVANAAAFLALVQFLQVVDHEGDPDRSRLLAFTMRFLAASGLAPRLDVCGRSGLPVPAHKSAYFDPALGAVVARRAGGGPFLLSGPTRARLLASASEHWLTTAREPWEPESLRTARAAVAAFVSAQVGEKAASRLFVE
jgi:DNA repair protein RecO (recombination protein O)